MAAVVLQVVLSGLGRGRTAHANQQAHPIGHWPSDGQLAGIDDQRDVFAVAAQCDRWPAQPPSDREAGAEPEHSPEHQPLGWDSACTSDRQQITGFSRPRPQAGLMLSYPRIGATSARIRQLCLAQPRCKARRQKPAAKPGQWTWIGCGVPHGHLHPHAPISRGVI